MSGPPPLDPAPGAADDPAAALADPGPAVSARVDGIVEGRVSNEWAVRDAAKKLNAAGFATMSLAIDGGRFSLLPDPMPLPPAAMTDERRRAFVEGLNALAAVSSGPLESTLRCTEVFRDAVRESMFLPESGGVRAITRQRAPRPEDLPPEEEPVAPMPRGKLAFVVCMLLVVAAIAAWTGGWIDAMFGAQSAEMNVDRAVFGDLLAVQTTDSFGSTSFEIRRGPGYPATTDAIEALRSKAATPSARAAVTVVADGGDVWVRLETRDGVVVAAARVALRPLLDGPERFAEGKLPRSIAGTTIRLALDAGERPK